MNSILYHLSQWKTIIEGCLKNIILKKYDVVYETNNKENRGILLRKETKENYALVAIGYMSITKKQEEELLIKSKYYLNDKRENKYVRQYKMSQLSLYKYPKCKYYSCWKHENGCHDRFFHSLHIGEKPKCYKDYEPKDGK